MIIFDFFTKALMPTGAMWWRNAWFHSALLAGAGLFLLIGCWDAPFTAYDDMAHVSLNREVTRGDSFDFLKPSSCETYFPVTKFSYRFDYIVFAKWLNIRNWAPGVRFMTCLYHILAAIFVWRIMLRLKLSRWQALFIGLAFAAHPLACETVCWVSERKNALAGMFGFAAIWAWLRWSERWWRLPLGALLYGLACLSKPSALGIFPVLMLLETFKIFNISIVDEQASSERAARRGESGSGSQSLDLEQSPSKRVAQRWWRALGYLMPLALISVIVIKVNLIGHAATLVKPPGGSVFTAMLTDIEIFSRYLFNLFAPVALSAVYFVDPITTIKDTRVLGYALLLVMIAFATIFFSINRRRAVFAWLWLIGALGPNLNLIAIPHFMQDRYTYLITPAFFLIMSDFFNGLIARAKRLSNRALLVIGASYLIMLITLAIARSFVFNSTLTIFADAVKKQPQAAFARWGLGMAYEQIIQLVQTQLTTASANISLTEQRLPASSRHDSQTLIEQCRRDWREQWRIGVDECPDTKRFAVYSVMAMTVGEDCNARHDLIGAERYWTLAAEFSNGQYDGRALAMGYLSSLRLTQKRPMEAYRYANDGMALFPDSTLLLARAKASLALADEQRQNGAKDAADKWSQMAREDLRLIVNDYRVSEQARQLLGE